MVCGRMDGELMAMARRFRAAYTRYGDDLSFSVRRLMFPDELALASGGWVGENVIVGVPLRRIIEANGFTVNTKKTRLQLHDCRQEVTGIVVNVLPNVSRGLIREIRAMLHAWERYGLDAAQDAFVARFDRRHRFPSGEEPSFRKVVKGKLDYVGMVRGNRDPVYIKLVDHIRRIDPSIAGPPLTPLQRRTGPLPGVGSDPGWTRWYRRYASSVFQLEINVDGTLRSGTAFAFRPHLLATAAHNLAGPLRVIHVTRPGLVEGTYSHERAEHGVDCAVISTAHGAESLPLAESMPEPGDPIAVIGYASVPWRHPSVGIYPGNVESISPNYDGSLSLIQVSVNAAGGLSGSPVINREGKVIGIVVESTFERTESGVPGREYTTVLPVAYISELRLRRAEQ
jgi:hypothetical protein